MKRALSLLLFLAFPAMAHGGAHDVGTGPPGWTLDPLITIPLLAALALYAIGFTRLWRRSDRGRGELRRGALLFGSGWLTLAAAAASPLHEAGERSFTLHMIEHELIMLVAALLLVASRPAAAMLWALPQGPRHAFAGGTQHSLWRLLTDPVVATMLQGIAMWAWHAPALFNRALGHQEWHIAQHLSFLLTALFFWWAMLHGRAGRHGYGVSAICLFATSLVGGLLGALMAFASSPWYAGYAAMGMSLTGLTPAEDQQLAGLIMWIPGGLFHGGAALWFFHQWLKASGGNAVPAR